MITLNIDNRFQIGQPLRFMLSTGKNGDPS